MHALEVISEIPTSKQVFVIFVTLVHSCLIGQLTYEELQISIIIASLLLIKTTGVGIYLDHAIQQLPRLTLCELIGLLV